MLTALYTTEVKNINSPGYNVHFFLSGTTHCFYSDALICKTKDGSTYLVNYDSNNVIPHCLPYSSFYVSKLIDEYNRSPSPYLDQVLWIVALLDRLQQVRYFGMTRTCSADLVVSLRDEITNALPSPLGSKFNTLMDIMLGEPITTATNLNVVFLAFIMAHDYIPTIKELARLSQIPKGVKLPTCIVAFIKALRKQRKPPSLVPQFDAKSHWQRLIRTQIKRNRHDRMQTALNRVESRKREIVRARCNAAQAAANPDGVDGVDGIPTRPTRPSKGVAWVAQEATGLSATAKRDAKKKVAREAIRAEAERKRLQLERQMMVEAERMRNLQIGDDLMRM